jgi:hypothetical protein
MDQRWLEAISSDVLISPRLQSRVLSVLALRYFPFPADPISVEPQLGGLLHACRPG